MPEYLKLALEYGLGGLALVGVLWLLWVCSKLETKLTSHNEREEERIKVCEKHTNNFSESFDRIRELEKKDVASDGRFDNIDDNLKRIGEDVTKIVDHFVAEGMKK